MLGENMKDINLDCRKQISAASLWRDNLYEIKQLVLDLSTSRTEIRAKIYANLGCKKDEKFKIIIFQRLFFDLLKLFFLSANILLPANSS